MGESALGWRGNYGGNNDDMGGEDHEGGSRSSEESMVWL